MLNFHYRMSTITKQLPWVDYADGIALFQRAKQYEGSEADR